MKLHFVHYLFIRAFVVNPTCERCYGFKKREIEKYKEKGRNYMIVTCKVSLGEIKELARHMIILVDSREKQNQHILEYFQKKKIAFEVQTLNYGDYSFYLPAGVLPKRSEPFYFHREIAVERKASLEELRGNLGKERERFETELRKARNDGCRLSLLVENPRGYNDIIEHHYHTEFQPVAYLASLKSFEQRYNLQIQFIDPQYTGYLIYSTFYYYMREALC